MNYVHWMDLIILLAGTGLTLGVLALAELIGGRK